MTDFDYYNYEGYHYDEEYEAINEEYQMQLIQYEE